MEIEILQKLNADEINFQIVGLGDDGYYFQVDGPRDKIDGLPTAIARNSCDLEEAISEMANIAAEIHPDSKFAEWWERQNGLWRMPDGS